MGANIWQVKVGVGYKSYTARNTLRVSTDTELQQNSYKRNKFTPK